MHFQLRYLKGLTLILCCILCSTNIVLGQTKQAAETYEAGLSALNNNDAQKAIQLFKLAASKDSQYVDPVVALFQVFNEQKNFQTAIDYFNEIMDRTTLYYWTYMNDKIKDLTVDRRITYKGTDFINIMYNINKYSYELEKNKGSRMIKNNLTNIMYNPINSIYFRNLYFIEKVFIDFPLISNIIYDEYEYIKQILSNIANIYELPIISPIKF